MPLFPLHDAEKAIYSLKVAEKTKFPLQMAGKAIHSLLNGRKRFLFIKELSPSALHGRLVPAHVSRIAGIFFFRKNKNIRQLVFYR